MSASTASTARNKHSKSNSKINNNNKNHNEPLDITKDELERFRQALSQEEFRKLFFEYVEEVQDPENRKLYEAEIAQLERERGVEIKFIHPKPGFVVKSSIDGELKCFINIASSPEVARPTSEVSVNQETGERGLNWFIPMAQTGAREDCDNKKQYCKVFDVVFHPDALHLGQKNSQFRKCLIDTALDAVEREYQVKLDRTNLKYPKLDYKGIPRPTVIRKLAENATNEELEPHPLEHIFPLKMPEANKEPQVLPLKTKAPPAPKFTEPKYSIKHSHEVDLSEYTDELDAKLQATKPRALVVEIELPLLRSTAECQLDVTSKSVYLLSERQGAKYRLKLDLPFPVDDKKGNARFDTDLRRLIITLPVVRSNPVEQRQMHDAVHHLCREDSGVELHSNSESPVEEEEEEVEAAEEEPNQVFIEDKPLAISSPRLFLKSSLHYQLPPKFDCNLLDNMLCFVLHVCNVQPDSLEHLQESRSLHLQFASMGSGFYPTNYAFYVSLPKQEKEEQVELTIQSVEAEAWDNNVVLKLFLNQHSDSLQSYLAGLDGQDLKEFPIYGQFQNQQQKPQEEEEEPPLDISVLHDEKNKALEITIRPPTEEEQQQRKPNKKQRKRNKKERSLSESACEEHNPSSISSSQPLASPGKLPQRKQRSYSECHDSHHRGILKRFSRYGPSISDSCSSIDDCSSSYSCSVDASGSVYSQSFGGIPEEEGLSESCKKTVRFNDHIMKQVFRLDSSILGQRKKNQKRRDCKLRAQQRRLSEGDSADYEETTKTAANAQYFKQPSGGEKHPNSKHSKHSSTLHDSGLDLTGNEKRHKNQEDAKNSMMFEMDDDM